MNEHAQALAGQLQSIEAACRDFDAGRTSAASTIAAALKAIFHADGPASSLLSRLGGTYARIASSVPKSGHSERVSVPLVRITLAMKNSYGMVFEATTGPTGLADGPKSAPALGRPADFRKVQAPDWWKAEPVFVLDHSRLTRRDLALWGARPTGPPDPSEKLPRLLDDLRAGIPAALKFAGPYGAEIEAPLADAANAALRQIAHELLASPELVRLAGTPGA